jgi:hypothetical protein
MIYGKVPKGVCEDQIERMWFKWKLMAGRPYRVRSRPADGIMVVMKRNRDATMAVPTQALGLVVVQCRQMQTRQLT